LKPVLKLESVWLQRLEVKYDKLLSSFGFNLKLRRYSKADNTVYITTYFQDTPVNQTAGPPPLVPFPAQHDCLLKCTTVPEYPYTLAASSSQAWPLVQFPAQPDWMLMCTSVPVRTQVDLKRERRVEALLLRRRRRRGCA